MAGSMTQSYTKAELSAMVKKGKSDPFVILVYNFYNI
ncbi:hypothetical protein CCACVL1_18690 [Corchorus capsularis]|uniref:Uncharacterized protein n=1 Tax=Corchorus capsularis TaxID=210143 RepID=A0A1R3HK10_COCAP|nr:hypothetical protein CCACVL1_18690 [Corchorus capsularis]